MAGLTMGTAMAANYPAPFVSGSTANAAIVYGTGSGASDLDLFASNAVQMDLGANLPATGSTSFVGGDVFTLDKTSDSMNIGDALNSVHSSLNEEEMETFLTDELEYDDGSIDETYDQKITLGTNVLSFFKQTDYNDDTPTLGFHFDNDDTVLTYAITFGDPGITMTDMNDTNMPFMGNEYYVLTSSEGSGIVVLDTAETTTVSKGTPVTVAGHVIDIAADSDSYIRFSVDGSPIDKLYELPANGDKYTELDDGSYLVLVSNLYDAKEAGITQAEFALGSGKIDLIDGEIVEFNDVDEDGLTMAFTVNSGVLDKMTLTWASDDDTFLTESSALTMPGFETIKLGLEDISFPSSPETITVENGDTLTLRMENFDIPVMWRNETDYQALGKDNYKLVLAKSDISNQTWTSPNLNSANASSGNLTGGLDLAKNDRFVVTVLNDDIGDVEQYYYQIGSIKNASGTIEVVLDDKIGTGGDITFDAIESKVKGDTTIWLAAINSTGSDARVYLNFTNDATITYNKVVSNQGLVIDLPASAAEDTTFVFREADRKADLRKGEQFTLTIGNTSNDMLHIKANNVTYSQKTADKEYTAYMGSALGTKVFTDKGGDEYDLEITYWGEEVKATVNVASSDATVVSEGVAQIMVVKDTEVSSVATKNLIVVGGSCINSAAADLVGGTHCGAAWTTATGVGSGQFMIKSYASSSLTSGIALLVAGYAKEDTTNAATFLRTKANLDTSAEYKGTSSTTATLVVA